MQIAPLSYPHLSHTEIFHSVEEFYRKFYFRAPKIASILAEMATSREMLKRRRAKASSSSAFCASTAERADSSNPLPTGEGARFGVGALLPTSAIQLFKYPACLNQAIASRTPSA